MQFLVLREEIPDPMIGFNAIFEVLKMGDLDLAKKFQQVINTVQVSGNNSLYLVKTEKKKVVVGVGQLVKLHFCVQVGYLDENTPVLFEPDEVQASP